jgi:hypothetical protein
MAVHAVAQTPAEPQKAAPPQQPQQQQQSAPPTPAPIIAPEQTPQPAIYQPNCASPADHDEADYCAQRAMADAAYKQLDLIWLQNLITGAEVAGLLVVIGLTLITIWQTRTYNRQQLRAYVMVVRIEVRNIGPATIPEAKLFLKNAGQTPAQDLTSYIRMGFAPFPLSERLTLDKAEHVSRETVGPGIERHITQVWDGLLGFDRYSALAAKTHAIFLFGYIAYRDVFGFNHRTNFRHYIGGNFGLESFTSHADGNEAD